MDDYPIYEEKQNKIWGFIPFGKKETEFVGYHYYYTSESAEHYAKKLINFIESPNAKEQDLLKIANEYKDIFTKGLNVDEYIKNKIIEVTQIYNVEHLEKIHKSNNFTQNYNHLLEKNDKNIEKQSKKQDASIKI